MLRWGGLRPQLLTGDLQFDATPETAMAIIAASSVERAITAQQDLQSFLEANISGIRDVDVTAIAVELTAYETQLQASYAALASIQSLNLLDYLR
jgi:flagellar hook-associated protein 3 FlgL